MMKHDSALSSEMDRSRDHLKESNNFRQANPLVDLLLDGQLLDHLQQFRIETKTDNLLDRSGNKLSTLTAVTYIDSDWNICSITYADLVEYCHLVYS